MTTNAKYGLPLRTQRLVLRNFSGTDWQDWLALRNRPETRKYGQYTEELSPNDARKEAELFADQGEHAPRLRYSLAIQESPGDSLVGYVGLKIFDGIDEGLSEMSYCLFPSRWRRGYATEAVKAAAQFAFEGLRLHRIEAGCSSQNFASQRVLEKAGFVFEGRIRQDMQVRKGVWQDEMIYGMLESDSLDRVLR